jgi:hypothetical protein
MQQTFKFDDWIAFFAALAGLSATIFSVMFVTFQVRSELWKDSRLRRAVATSALGELLVALFVSLISLMAGNPWRAATMVAGGFGVIVILTHWYFFILDRAAAKSFDHAQAKAAWFSFTLYVTIFICGFLNPRPALYIIASISTWLLFSGASEAFLLLSFREDLKRPDKGQFTHEFATWTADTISSIRKLTSRRNSLPLFRSTLPLLSRIDRSGESSNVWLITAPQRSSKCSSHAGPRPMPLDA